MIYTIKNVARNKACELEALTGLNNLVSSIDHQALEAEVLRIEKLISVDVEAWANGFKHENQPAYLVTRAALAVVRFSARSKKAAFAVARAHQRLMLEHAHLQGIDISIDN